MVYNSNNCDIRYYTDYYDNPYDSKISEEREKLTDEFISAFGRSKNEKLRNWPVSREWQQLEVEMESFFYEYLPEIQNLAKSINATVHFGKQPLHRTSGLEKFASITPPYSFRVTKNGDIWVLFNKVIGEWTAKVCYSPTLGTFGVKKGINENSKNIYESLSQLTRTIEASNEESPIVPILDLVKIPNKLFVQNESFGANLDDSYLNEEKYSLITQKFDHSLAEILEKDIASKEEVKEKLIFFAKSTSLWLELMQNYGIIHPDFHSGNVVFDIIDGKLTTKFIDFDELNAIIPKTININEDIYPTKNLHLNFLPEFESLLKSGLNTIVSDLDLIINKIITFSITENTSEKENLIILAKSLVESASALAFGVKSPLVSQLSNFDRKKEIYMANCEKKMCLIGTETISTIQAKVNLFIQEIQRIIQT